jgi:hypothetical protein
MADASLLQSRLYSQLFFPLLKIAGRRNWADVCAFYRRASNIEQRLQKRVSVAGSASKPCAKPSFLYISRKASFSVAVYSACTKVDPTSRVAAG